MLTLIIILLSVTKGESENSSTTQPPSNFTISAAINCFARMTLISTVIPTFIGLFILVVTLLRMAKGNGSQQTHGNDIQLLQEPPENITRHNRYDSTYIEKINPLYGGVIVTYTQNLPEGAASCGSDRTVMLEQYQSEVAYECGTKSVDNQSIFNSEVIC
ncbi:hypothetical protein AOXY_G8826 [Acipenser oxyrinchus oxyrinchus]|uniref:Uncharacterized protein n=1 Tax=Acipenser oxyrinchus oxyrinchus TaxID=40147 RepID=A0AAD8G8Y4_ACIOX|nr:hypothetical protein AOXY_G8826 [Acipenser oxyrinchus oxyrinchus]